MGYFGAGGQTHVSGNCTPEEYAAALDALRSFHFQSDHFSIAFAEYSLNGRQCVGLEVSHPTSGKRCHVELPENFSELFAGKAKRYADAAEAVKLPTTRDFLIAYFDKPSTPERNFFDRTNSGEVVNEDRNDVIVSDQNFYWAIATAL